MLSTTMADKDIAGVTKQLDFEKIVTKVKLNQENKGQKRKAQLLNEVNIICVYKCYEFLLIHSLAEHAYMFSIFILPGL